MLTEKHGYYFVIAPNVIRFEHDETVVVSVFEETDAAVKLWMEHAGKQFSMKNVVVKDQETPTYTTVKVRQADVFDDVFNTDDYKKPRKVKLCSEWKGTQRSREIILSYHSGYLIVQTDKPIYTPLQKVKVRTLALDESLKANGVWQVGMDIISPSNFTLGRRLMKNSDIDTGFFQNDFTLPPYPEMGIWTARAFYDGPFETESHTHFEVREYVLSTFVVTVDVDVEFLLPTTKSITVIVKAKYVYGKPVQGNARLTLKLKGENENRDYILNVDRKTLEVVLFEGSTTKFNIKVDEILNSPLLRDKPFPSNKRLEIIAMVYESATGKEEARTHDRTIFTMNPYVFKFKSKPRCQQFWQYSLEVEVQYVNGTPATYKELIVRMSENGQLEEEKMVSTNKDGLATTIFGMDRCINKKSITVSTADNQYESDVFEVDMYRGQYKVRIELSKPVTSAMRFMALVDIPWLSDTELLFVVVSRGKVVFTKFQSTYLYTVYEEISEDLQELVSPDARLLLFYVDKSTNELVADSIKFEVKKKCRGEGLKVETLKREVAPGTNTLLTLTGTPFMFVGLNIMDKALLSQNDRNVLQKSKMFETLQSHDLGCGEGGGRSAADVLQKTGLTMLTNALLDENDIVRTTAGCKGDTRKRRDAYGQLDEISDYREDMESLDNLGIKSYTRSDNRGSLKFDGIYALDNNGQKKILLRVPDSITEWSIQTIGITDNRGMCIGDEIDLKSFRDFFIQLDLPFKVSRFEHFYVKATIFNYSFRHNDNKTASIYLQGVDSICSNSDPGEPTPRINIELPPNSEKVVVFPVIPLKSGLYPVKLSAIVMQRGIPEVDVIEKNLYVVNEGIEEKVTIIVCLDPMRQTYDCVNDLRVVDDIQLSMDERQYEIDLTLPGNSIPQTGAATAYIQSSRMTNVVDTIIKGVDSLFRKPIGFGEQTIIRLATNVYALTYLKETKQEWADIGSIVVQWIRDGVKRQISQYRKADGSYAFEGIRQPSTWLTAFVAKVFCQAKQVLDDAVDRVKDLTPTIDWLNKHVEADNLLDKHREMIGQRINERDPALTAFVLITLQECGFVRSSFYKSTVGLQYLEGLSESKLKSSPFLLAITSYALILSESTKKATFVKYLKDIQNVDREGTFWGNPGGKPANAHSVETTAYALLAMLQYGDIKTSSSIVSWLTSQRDGTGSFRTTQDTVVGLQALSQYSIVAFSSEINLQVTLSADRWYRFHTMITRENTNLQHIIKKLPLETKGNKLTVNVKGGGSAVMSIDLHYNRPATEEETCPFTITDIDVQDVEDPPIETNFAKERNCDVCGRCYQKNHDKYDGDDFGDVPEIDPKVKSKCRKKKRDADSHRFQDRSKEICIRFSVSSKNDKTYGMSIVKFWLETGVMVIKSDIEKLVKENIFISNYEMPSDGKGFIVFYLHEISSSKTNFVFRLKDYFDGEINSRQPSSVDVYDYHNPDKHCTRFYGTGPNRGKSISYQCEENSKECKCFRSICMQPVEKEIERLSRRQKRPELKLYRYACNTNKADYAVRVRIEKVTFDVVSQENIARGTVVHSFIQGIENLEPGDDMQFFWKFWCQFPALQEEKTYIIIGKDGYKVINDEGQIFRYPLMVTTLVMEYMSPQQARKLGRKYRMLQTVQTNFERLMTGGCLY